jgi:hypothetical protein
VSTIRVVPWGSRSACRGSRRLYYEPHPLRDLVLSQSSPPLPLSPILPIDMVIQRFWIGIATCWVGCGLAAVADEPIDFAHRVVPILRKHCVECHAGDQQKGGFSINTRESTVAGGESGSLILPADGSLSELLHRVESTDADLRMPPQGPQLTDDEVATLRVWIDEKLPWDSGFTFGQRAYEPPLKPRRPELPPPSLAERVHPIDRILDAELRARGEPLTVPASDAVFVRRLYLDLIGLLPTPEETYAYVADSAPDKRERLIRALLARDLDYAEHWLSFWNDLLRNDYSGTGFITGGRTQISKWLYDALVSNKPYDLMTRELIAPPSPESAGFANGIRWRGEVSAGQTVEIQFAQSVGQSFLGINLKCASCHDSFVDRWTLQEAYGLAAIYSERPLEIHRCDKPIGQTAKAGWLFPELGEVDPNASQPERLKQLAALMTHPENGRFSRTIVNRLWHRLMGVGIVHPTDAMQSQPWNEDLLDYLASSMADHRFDLKEMLFVIASSEAYRSIAERVEPSATVEAYRYAGPRAKRLTAEQFVDAVWQLTGAAPKAMDAPVVRTRGGESIGLQGNWIWSDSAKQKGGPKAGESVAFRKSFEIDFPIEKAFGVITCDNGYQLWINGRRVAQDDNWESVEGFAAKEWLRAGNNEILIVGTNGGSGPNPAALFFEMAVEGDGRALRIATSEEWQTTLTLPDAAGVMPDGEGAWKPAVVATGPWGERLSGELNNQLAVGLVSGSRMVRAGLVKSDFLMRSLGRPNRDQIVSMRPTELTTLEAMDLSNGQTLADWLHQGAEKWHRRVASDAIGGDLDNTPIDLQRIDRQIIDPIMLAALSRTPSPAERATIHEAIGETLEVEEIEDVLWSILMLPEFHYVR